MYGMLSRSGLFLATSAGVVALSATMSHAGEDVWIWIGPSPGSFHDALNWKPGSVPGQQDIAVFEETGRYTVLFSQNVVNTVLNVDDGEATFELGFQSYQVNELVVADHIDVVPLVRLTLLHGTVSVVSPGFFVRIGKDPAATGELIVSTGANFISSEDVLIGDAGSGLLVVLNGGTASTATTFLGEDVGADGTATVQGPNSQWTNSASLIVGNLGTGSLNVLGGGSVLTNVSFLGDDPGAVGSATIDGVGSQWTNSASIIVGNFGTGSLSVLSGGSVITNASFLGDDPGGVGSATIDGLGSHYDHSASLFVGNMGTGSLMITNNGGVSAQRTFIGDDLGSNGIVVVQGKGSSWTNTIAVFVGNFGTGSVTISNGALASSNITKIGDEAGALGTAVIDGAGSSWVNSTDLVVGNRGSGALTVSNGGSASAADGFIGDDPGSVGNVTITGAGSSLTCTTQLAVGRLGEGNLTVSDGATATAPLITINNQSSMNGDGTIQADVTSAGTVAPGLSVGQLAIEGSYLQTSLGRLHAELDGTGNDQLAMTGDAELAGTLQLSLINGFIPKVGQEFIILTAGSVLGTFDEVVGPNELEVVYGAGTVTVVVAGTVCPGDFDGSGDVGVKDLLILLGAWGPCPPKGGCPADFDGSGDVGVKDLLILLGNWGPCP